MSNKLQTTSKIIPNEQCNFVLLNIPEEVRCILSMDIIVETNHKLIEFHIGHNLSLSYTGIMQYIGGKENIIRCESGIDSTGFRNTHGRMGYVLCITYEQFLMLWEKATHPYCLKKKPIVAEFIATKVIPLFTRDIQNVSTPRIGINLNNTNEPLAMSSQEIADVAKSRHDNVRTTIERLVTRGVIVQPAMQDEQIKDKMGRNRTQKVYMVNKRDSYIVVAQLSPEFTADLVDRWQELEKQVAQPALPQITPPTPIKEIDRPQPTKQLNASFLKAAIKQIEEMTLSKDSKQVLKAHLLHEQAGLPLELMLPVTYEEKLSPAQIAEQLKVSPQAIGRIITKLGLRGNDDYCEGRLSQSVSSSKEVVMYFYNHQAVQMIKQRLEEKKSA